MATANRRVRLNTGYNDVPAGQPVDVTEEEYGRLKQLGVVASHVRDDEDSPAKPPDLSVQE